MLCELHIYCYNKIFIKYIRIYDITFATSYSDFVIPIRNQVHCYAAKDRDRITESHKEELKINIFDVTKPDEKFCKLKKKKDYKNKLYRSLKSKV